MKAIEENLRIRPLSIADYSALIALWEKAGLDYKATGRDTRENIEQELHGKQSIFLVAESDGRIVGSVLATHDGRKGWVNRLAVDPDVRRRGIARKLVARAEEAFEQLGIEIFACLVEDWNTSSMQLFEDLGYKAHTDATYFSKRKHPDV